MEVLLEIRGGPDCWMAEGLFCDYLEGSGRFAGGNVPPLSMPGPPLRFSTYHAHGFPRGQSVMSRHRAQRAAGHRAWLSLLGCLLFVGTPGAAADLPHPVEGARLFARDNLVAWCIVPFDQKKRGPEERATMLKRLGFTRFAYDWRPEHVATFDAEIDALKRQGIRLEAFWVAPGELNRESRLILDVLKRHEIKTDLWVILDLGSEVKVSAEEQTKRIQRASDKLQPLAEAAGAIGCTVGLYNHGGWFGEPENQINIIDELKLRGVSNVGFVYNLHHGHSQLVRLSALLKMMMPYLHAINLNGMDLDGEAHGRKILPLGQGSLDLVLLRLIQASGYRGPIGILGHTNDDAEARLLDNLDGLDWLLPQLEGKPTGPRPSPRTPVPPRPQAERDDPKRVAELVAEARANGDPARGAEVFVDARYACLSCHKVGNQGGLIGPELSTVGKDLSAEQIVESVLWPGRTIKEGYVALTIATADGKVIQGYRQSETEKELVVREAATGQLIRISKADIEDTRIQGTLMPEGLAASFSSDQRKDLIRFLFELGRSEKNPLAHTLTLPHHAHGPATFPYDRAPLHPERWPNWQEPVNRERLYDFYAKEAEYFRRQPTVPSLLPQFPGLDGGVLGHWGNQSEDTWSDNRWNQSDLGTVLSGVFHGGGVTVPKGVCVRLGDRGELATCFNPETLCYEAVWQGGFLKFAPKRHGILDGLLMDGTKRPRPEGSRPTLPFVYHGFYRSGQRVVFSYRVGDNEMLDAPWVDEKGQFTRTVGPAEGHPLAHLTRGGPAQWPQVFETRGKLGSEHPYAIDTIEPPFKNPWNALLFFAGNDFNRDGTAFLCTIQGDVWRVEGLDESLKAVRWRRVASGLHQALGLVVEPASGKVDVLGRDQITRLHDLDGDGETDFYECVTNAYITSPAGHDFICGLERDPAGNFYTASGKQGLIRLSPDTKAPEVLATGFRNPDGLSLSPEGVLTVPSSEGDWVSASMVCEVRPGGHYGFGGPKNGQTPDLPLVYLPRGLDNSAGGQVTVPDDRWGPLRGQMVHLSHGAGSHFLLLRETVDGQPQGATVPLTGDFLSGIHRGRFNPRDGQLYVTGSTGWGTYTPLDGCFQRVRYTGDPVQVPVAFHAHRNGVMVEFSRPVDPAVATVARNQFVQCWNYRYSSAYGSPELSPRHPGTVGHDPLTVRSAHVLNDGRSVFLELPDLQPVNQLHLHLKVDSGEAHDLFATVHKLAAPFTGFPGYRPEPKTIAVHPILADLAGAKKSVPNPWRKSLSGARTVTIKAGKNLTYSATTFNVRAGEPIKLTFINPDVVPHNWALIRPGSLYRVGDLANKIIAEPDAAIRQYIPKSDDILVHTDVVPPEDQFSISFRAPAEPGRYPYLCTFPGHWMVMNGVMVVE